MDLDTVSNSSREGKCSDLGVPAPCGRPPRRIASLKVHLRRGGLSAKGQKRVARAIRLWRMTGDVGVSPTTEFPLLLAKRRGPGG